MWLTQAVTRHWWLKDIFISGVFRWLRAVPETPVHYPFPTSDISCLCIDLSYIIFLNASPVWAPTEIQKSRKAAFCDNVAVPITTDPLASWALCPEVLLMHCIPDRSCSLKQMFTWLHRFSYSQRLHPLIIFMYVWYAACCVAQSNRYSLQTEMRPVVDDLLLYHFWLRLCWVFLHFSRKMSSENWKFWGKKIQINKKLK